MAPPPSPASDIEKPPGDGWRLRQSIGCVVNEIRTEAIVSMKKGDAGFSISGIKLVSKAKVPEIKMEEFAKIDSGVKENCPVLKAL